MRVVWFVGIVDMSIRSKRGLRISCCRITWCKDLTGAREWRKDVGIVTKRRGEGQAERGSKHEEDGGRYQAVVAIEEERIVVDCARSSSSATDREGLYERIVQYMIPKKESDGGRGDVLGRDPNHS